MTAIDTMAGRLAQIRLRIAHACQRAGRDPLDVTLLPVSKTFGVDAVREAMALGLTRFGENKTQEIRQKAAALSGQGLQWVLIGHLQTNKAKTPRATPPRCNRWTAWTWPRPCTAGWRKKAARWTRWCRSRPPASPASTAWRRKRCRPSCAASRPTSPRCACAA